MRRRREILAFLLLLALGVGLRFTVIAGFPTIPVSDFHNLITFGQALSTDKLTRHAPYFWEGFNVGMPLVLGLLFQVLPKANPDAVARMATALVNGLLPLLPFFLWRGVLPLRLRVLAGAALALWPGQVFFSGVVAQDNWVLFPSIALAVVAVRALADGERALPVTAALMYTAAAAMRSDMLLLLPLLLAAIRVDLLRTRRRTAVVGSVAAVLGLVGLASYRYAASGRFSLAPEFGGLAILGSYLPTASYSGWVAPYPYLASVEPDLLRDSNRKAMLTRTSAMGVREALRRPGFHALRIISMAGYYSIDGEYMNLYSSIDSPQVLPERLRERGAALAAWLKQPLRLEMGAIQGLFLAALLVGLWRRSRPLLYLSAAVVMKLGFHAFGVFQGRYFLAATGLEILTIAVAVEEVLRMAPAVRRSLTVRALAPGLAFALALFFLAPGLLAYVQSRDLDQQQHTYQFFLNSPDRTAELDCRMDRGMLASLSSGFEATLRTLQTFDPAPGDRAVADCVLTGSGAPRPLMLQVFDPFDAGGLGGRMAQRVTVDGEEVFYHDIAEEPGGGWADIPLGNVGAGDQKKVRIEVEALHPEAGRGWAYNSRTTFQLTKGSSAMHLAMNRPTAQSSTYPGTTSRAAVDGKIDGSFYSGSVTSTNREAHAWWQVDLGSSRAIRTIVIWNRTDCCGSRLEDYWVFLSDTPFGASDTPETLQRRPGIWKSHQLAAPDPATTLATGGAQGRYVRVQLTGTDYLSLAEVQVFGVEKPLHSGMQLTPVVPGAAAPKSGKRGYAGTIAS